MINLSVAQSVVADRSALIHGGEGVAGKSTNTVIRKWENVHPEHIEDAVEYLRLYTSSKNGNIKRMSASDLKLAKTSLDGVWRGGRVTTKRDGQGKHTIFQELHEGFIRTVKKGSAFDFSEFLTEDGHLWHSGASQPVLRLPNVDPAKVESIRAELQAASTFSSPVTKYETLTGTFYYIDTKPRHEEDGSYSILLFLSKHNNQDLYFKFKADPDTIKGFFYKWEATTTTLAVLMESIQFDSVGAIVTSGGKTLQEDVPGRKVEMRRTARDPEDRLFDVEIEITWSAAYTLKEASESIVFQKFEGASVAVDQGFNIPDTLLPNYSALYTAASLDENQLGNFQFERDTENGTFKFTGSITTLTARQGYMDCGDKWIFFGGQVSSTSELDVPTAIDASGKRTFAQFKAALSEFKAEGSVSASTETGLFAYNIQVTKNGTASSEVAGHSASKVEQTWIENGKGPVLPVDVVSTFDDEYGRWYEVVDFNFEGVAGNYSWIKKTTRYQITEEDYTPFTISREWEKKDIVINRTFQPVRYRTRGGWKEEAVSWCADWDDYAFGEVSAGETPPSWISRGYQAVYGNWQPWFVKAEYSVGDDFGAFIGRAGTGFCRYTPDRFGQKPLHYSLKTNDAGAVGGFAAWSNASSVVEVETQARNLAYTHSLVVKGFSSYTREVLLLKKYKVRREYMRWCAAFDSYQVGGANAGDTPPEWESYGYLERYGEWNTNYVKALCTEGDNSGALIGLYGTSSSRYTPPPQNIGMNYTLADAQTGDVGGFRAWSNASSVKEVETQARDLTTTYTTPAHGYSVYDHVLAEATVLSNSGEPEMDGDTGVQLSAIAYEHPAFSVTGQRKRRKTVTTVERLYLVVNPALISNPYIPAAESSLTGGTNTSIAYKVVRVSEYLWAIEKQTTKFHEWEADLLETEDGEIRNFPQVNPSGHYHYYDFPQTTNSVFGTDTTAGKVSYIRTVYD